MKLMEFVAKLKFFKINFLGGRGGKSSSGMHSSRNTCHPAASPAALKLSFLTTHSYHL
jgi:hypothetical protein